MPSLLGAPPEAAPADGRLTFRAARGRAGLDSLRPEWDAVLSTTERPQFYHQYDWLDTLLESWPGQAPDIHVFTAYRGGVPVAICPLQLTVRRSLGVSLRILAPPRPHYLGYSDFVGPGSSASPGLLAAMVDALRASDAVRWDTFELPDLLDGSAASRSLADRAPAGVLMHARGRCFSLPADQPFSELAKRCSKSFRSHLRRQRRLLSDMGLEVVTSRDPALLPELLDEFLALEASGWKGEAGARTAIRCDPVLLGFYRGLVSRFGAVGGCEVNLLRVGGRAAAGQFCLLSGGTWYHLKIAYDEALAKYSPGNVLLESVLERLCGEDGIHTANLLTGEEWAERWRPDAREVRRLVASSGSIGGSLLLAEARVRRLLRERVVPRLERLRRPPLVPAASPA